MTISNQPPAFDAISMDIEDLYAEAQAWLNGDGVESDADAEGVAKLLDMARQSKKAADEKRAEEKRPHDEAAKAVQAKWKPLLERCDLIVTTAKKALTPFLEAKEAQQRAEAERARQEAIAAERAAQAALEASQANIDARAEAERMLKDAGRAHKDAAKLDRAKPQAAGMSRAIGLRTRYVAELTDPTAALRHYRGHQPELLKAWLIDQAQRDANAGVRTIPGFTITAERVAA